MRTRGRFSLRRLRCVYSIINTITAAAYLYSSRDDNKFNIVLCGEYAYDNNYKRYAFIHYYYIIIFIFPR